MLDFWISNGFVVVYDGNTLMRVEHTGEGRKVENRQLGE